jgi:hypothetical protein
MYSTCHKQSCVTFLYTVKWLSPIIPRAGCSLDWHVKLLTVFLEKQSQREINSFKSNRIENKISPSPSRNLIVLLKTYSFYSSFSRRFRKSETQKISIPSRSEKEIFSVLWTFKFYIKKKFCKATW